MSLGVPPVFHILVSNIHKDTLEVNCTQKKRVARTPPKFAIFWGFPKCSGCTEICTFFIQKNSFEQAAGVFYGANVRRAQIVHGNFSCFTHLSSQRAARNFLHFSVSYTALNSRVQNMCPEHNFCPACTYSGNGHEHGHPHDPV